MNVLEELVDPDVMIDRQHVERRVVDWKRRVDRLYADVSTWLPSAWSARAEGYVRFEEELMVRFDVLPEKLPVLMLRGPGQMARLEPRGLWIIGLNGRIDFIRADQHFVIVDRAEAFETPDWQVANIQARQRQRPLDAVSFREMLG